MCSGYVLTAFLLVFFFFFFRADYGNSRLQERMDDVMTRLKDKVENMFYITEIEIIATLDLIVYEVRTNHSFIETDNKI